MKIFSDDWLSRLNAKHSGGVFVKAAILSITDVLTGYYADTQRAITFDGNAYSPMPMSWQGTEQNSGMQLPSVQVVIPTIDGQVGTFLENNDLRGRDVTLQLLHLDLLSMVTDVDKVRLQVMMVEWDWQVATFTLSLNLGLQEQLPRHVITKAEFPGVPDSYRRASIL